MVFLIRSNSRCFLHSSVHTSHRAWFYSMQRYALHGYLISFSEFSSYCFLLKVIGFLHAFFISMHLTWLLIVLPCFQLPKLTTAPMAACSDFCVKGCKFKHCHGCITFFVAKLCSPPVCQVEKMSVSCKEQVSANYVFLEQQ